MNATTLTRTERKAWEAKRDLYEGAVIEKARRAGRLAVIDCTDPKYPVPSHILRELDRMASPEAREAIYREAASLRRKASSLRSLAVVLDRDGKKDQAQAMIEKAAANELEADQLEANVAPV